MEIATTKDVYTSINWKQTEKEFFTSDDVVEAYLAGKREGLNSERRALLDKLNANINEAGKATSNIFKYIQSKSITPKDVYLKIEAWDTLSIIVLVEESDYLKGDFNEVYENVCLIEDTFNKEYTHLFFSFIADSGKLNIEHLQSDGYIFVYTKDEA
jgi:hypothetical protein